MFRTKLTASSIVYCNYYSVNHVPAAAADVAAAVDYDAVYTTDVSLKFLGGEMDSSHETTLLLATT